MTRVRRVLHPSDFSPASGAAFTKAVEVAKANRAELIVAHALPPVAPMVGDGYLSPQTFAEIDTSTRAHAQAELARLTARGKKAGVRVRPLLLDGVPHQAITRAAKRARVDLIVMGTHGRTGFAKLFLGSVAERVLPLAPCPVLTVRGREK